LIDCILLYLHSDIVSLREMNPALSPSTNNSHHQQNRSRHWQKVDERREVRLARLPCTAVCRLQSHSRNNRFRYTTASNIV